MEDADRNLLPQLIIYPVLAEHRILEVMEALLEALKRVEQRLDMEAVAPAAVQE